jgi:hypothetical protein
MGDPVFDAFYASTVQFVSNEMQQQTAAQKAGAALVDTIGKPVVLLGHSQAGAYPPLISDVRPHLVRSMILPERRGPPFQEAVFSRRKESQAMGFPRRTRHVRTPRCRPGQLTRTSSK